MIQPRTTRSVASSPYGETREDQLAALMAASRRVREHSRAKLEQRRAAEAAAIDHAHDRLQEDRDFDLTGLPPLVLAGLLQRVRRAMERTEERGDVQGWEHAAQRCVRLLLEVDRRTGPDKAYRDLLEAFGTDLDAGLLGPSFGRRQLSRRESRVLDPSRYRRG